MIRSWGNGATRRFAEVGKSKFSGMNVDVAEKRLAALEAATSLADLTPLGRSDCTSWPERGRINGL
jgi:proteic killer suppression protein